MKALNEMEDELNAIINRYKQGCYCGEMPHSIAKEMAVVQAEMRLMKEWHVEEMYEFIKWVARDDGASPKFRLIANELLAALEKDAEAGEGK